jgi:hypothetical protein
VDRASGTLSSTQLLRLPRQPTRRSSIDFGAKLKRASFRFVFLRSCRRRRLAKHTDVSALVVSVVEWSWTSRTAVRAVGWLSRLDLKSRPEPARPGLRTPEAQCLGETRARLAVTFGLHPQAEAWDAELGFRAVPAGPNPILPAGQGLVTLDGPGVFLSALKPAEDGNGFVARLLNPTEMPTDAVLQWSDFGGEVSEVRLDEGPAIPSALSVDSHGAVLRIPAHHLRSLRIGAPGLPTTGMRTKRSVDPDGGGR